MVYENCGMEPSEQLNPRARFSWKRCQALVSRAAAACEPELTQFADCIQLSNPAWVKVGDNQNKQASCYGDWRKFRSCTSSALEKNNALASMEADLANNTYDKFAAAKAEYQAAKAAMLLQKE